MDPVNTAQAARKSSEGCAISRQSAAVMVKRAAVGSMLRMRVGLGVPGRHQFPAAARASSSAALIRVTALDTDAGAAPAALAASAGRILSHSTMRAASCAGPAGLRISSTSDLNCFGVMRGWTMPRQCSAPGRQATPLSPGTA